MPGGSTIKRVLLEGLGWLLVIGGIAALVLPGPGLLLLFAGMAILSQQYEWAERRLDPIKQRAVQTAADSVKSWPRIVGSVLGTFVLVGFGVLWIVRPDAPGWWPLDEAWWLFGGWAAGVTLIISAAIALGMIVYSYRNFRVGNEPEPAQKGKL